MKKLRALLKHAFALLLAIVLFTVTAPPWYDYPAARPFVGPSWYDPYEGLAEDALWLRTNTHAHSVLFGVLAFGNASVEEVRATYKSSGYDVYPLTNYQTVTEAGPLEEIPLPCYEHGYGVQKVHQTVVGAKSSVWFDLPLFQLTDGKQWILDSLRPHSELVFLNHPDIRGGYSHDDLAQVCGYDAMEVFTGSSSKGALDRWDAALSAGRRAWGITADDGHRPNSKGQFGRGALFVNATARTPEAVYEALRAGRFYGVYSRRYEPPNALKSFRFADGTLSVALAEPASSLRFVGQGGEILAEFADSDRASYAPTERDTYVRVEAHTRRTILLTNPLHRYAKDPAERSALRATPVPALTWLRRLGGLLLFGVALGLLYRRPVSEAATDPAEA